MPASPENPNPTIFLGVPIEFGSGTKVTIAGGMQVANRLLLLAHPGDKDLTISEITKQLKGDGVTLEVIDGVRKYLTDATTKATHKKEELKQLTWAKDLIAAVRMDYGMPEDVRGHATGETTNFGVELKRHTNRRGKKDRPETESGDQQ
jgi:hypothetical protein